MTRHIRLIPYAGAGPPATGGYRAYAPLKPETVLTLFRDGLDTAEISGRLRRSEATVSNALVKAFAAENAKIIRRTTP